MHRHTSTWIAASVALTWFAPVNASAQRGSWQDDPHFAAKLMLGVAGEAELGNADDDMEVTWGAGVHYLHPLLRYFALGGVASFQVWQTEAFDDVDADANMFFDLALLPAGTLPVSDKVQLYVAMPIGLSLDFWGDDDAAVTVAGYTFGGEVDPALGFVFSLLAGVRFAIGDSWGLLAELGYVLHSYEHEVDLVAGPLATGNIEMDVDIEQLAIHLGAWF